VDQDCDDRIDEEPADGTIWYDDADEDGYGDPATGAASCEGEEGQVTDDQDCDDSRDEAWPGAEELCNESDDDCDDAVDEDFGGVDCFGCGAEGAIVECEVSITDDTVTCDGESTPVTVHAAAAGLVLQIDMAGYTSLRATMTLSEPSGWLWHLGNSPTNDGYGGDNGDNQNDSEAHAVLGTELRVFSNDLGGTELLLEASDVSDPVAADVEVEVCDGQFHYRSGTYTTVLVDDYIFQVDGDEADSESGGTNDTIVYLGLERTVNNVTRTGGDLTSVQVRLRE